MKVLTRLVGGRIACHRWDSKNAESISSEAGLERAEKAFRDLGEVRSRNTIGT